MLQGLSIKRNRPALDIPNSHYHLGKSLLSVSIHTGDSHDGAGGNREGQRPQRSVFTLNRIKLQTFGGKRERQWFAFNFLELPTNHQGRKLFFTGFTSYNVSGISRSPKDRDTVGYGQYFIDVMRNDDD